MGLRLLALAARIRRDAANAERRHDLGPDGGVEGEDDAGRRLRRKPPEAFELEDRRFQPQQQARIGPVRQPRRARPARRPFRPAEDRRQPSGSGAALRARLPGTSAKPLNGGPPMNLEPVTNRIAPRAR
jgi:hypothetical protein